MAKLPPVADFWNGFSATSRLMRLFVREVSRFVIKLKEEGVDDKHLCSVAMSSVPDPSLSGLSATTALILSLRVFRVRELETLKTPRMPPLREAMLNGPRLVRSMETGPLDVSMEPWRATSACPVVRNTKWKRQRITTHPSDDAAVGAFYRDVVKDDGFSNFAEHLSKVGQVRLKVLDVQSVAVGGFWKLDCNVEPQVVMAWVSRLVGCLPEKVELTQGKDKRRRTKIPIPFSPSPRVNWHTLAIFGPPGRRYSRRILTLATSPCLSDLVTLTCPPE